MKPTKEELQLIAGMGSGPTKEELQLIAGMGSGAGLSVEDVAHPDVSFKNRFMVKNLAQSPEKGAEYLRQQMPGYDIQVQDGEIVLKKPEEQTYKKLDPSGFDIQDISDIAYDVGAGVATGAATAAGGVVGNLPGAAAAGAASSAGLEALRQKLGQYAGIQQEVSPEDVAIAGTFGAVSPLLMGTGASAKQVAQQALKKGVSKEAITEAQKGLLQRGYQKLTRKVMPSLAEAVSGVQKDAYKTAIKNPQAMQVLDDIGEHGVANMAGEQMYQAEEAALKATGKEYQDVVRKSGQKVDLTSFRKQLDESIQNIAQKPAISQRESERMALLNKLKDRVFKKTNPIDGSAVDIGSVVDAGDALEILDTVRFGGDIFDDPLKKKSEEKFVDSMLKGWSSDIKQSLENAIPERKDLAKKYAEGLDNLSLLNRYKSVNAPETPFGEKMLGVLYNKNAAKKEGSYAALQKIAKKHGMDLDKTSDSIIAHKYLADPSLTPISSKGSTSTSRTIGVRALGGAVGYTLGQQTGDPYMGSAIGMMLGGMAGSPAAMKALLKAGYSAEQIMKGVAQQTQGMLPGQRQMYLNSAWNMLNSGKEKE